MTRKRAPGARKKTGPKTVFTNKQLEMVELLTKLGASNEQVGSFFGVNSDTVIRWKDLPDFKAAQQRGGIEADLKVVASLYQRAVGFAYEETKSVRTANGDFLIEVTKKHQIPDVKAIMQWLSVRQRDIWTMTATLNHQHNVSGKIEHMHANLDDIPVDELDAKTQDFLFEIAQKQLSNGERNN